MKLWDEGNWEDKSRNREMFKRSLVTLANGPAQAIARADGWLALNYPNHAVTFEIHHVGYSDLASAYEHGAIIPEYVFPTNA